jgi:hypothetical protein
MSFNKINGAGSVLAPNKITETISADERNYTGLNKQEPVYNKTIASPTQPNTSSSKSVNAPSVEYNTIGKTFNDLEQYLMHNPLYEEFIKTGVILLNGADKNIHRIAFYLMCANSCADKSIIRYKDYKIRPNLYIGICGKTTMAGKSSAKTHIKKWSYELNKALGNKNAFIGTDFSPEGLTYALLEKSVKQESDKQINMNTFIQKDEFTGLLASKQDYKSGVKDMLTELYNENIAYKTLLTKRNKNKQDGYNDLPDSAECYVNFMGLTTPTGMREIFTEKDADKGLTHRFIYMYMCDRPDIIELKGINPDVRYKALKKRCEMIEKIAENIKSYGATIKNPITLMLNNTAENLLTEWWKQITKNDPVSRRMLDYTFKFALIHAISQGLKEIDESCILLAIADANYFMKQKRDFMSGVNDVDKGLADKLLNYIKGNSQYGTPVKFETICKTWQKTDPLKLLEHLYYLDTQGKITNLAILK